MYPSPTPCPHPPRRDETRGSGTAEEHEQEQQEQWVMTMAGRGLLRVRRDLAALVAACLPVLAGCSHATPPAPVATSLPSAPTWLCPGVPWEAVSPIVGSGPYVLPLYNSKNVYYWIVLGFVEGWLCRGGCRGGGGGVVAMVAVFGGGG
jgi:hypothetical protein